MQLNRVRILRREPNRNLVKFSFYPVRFFLKDRYASQNEKFLVRISNAPRFVGVQKVHVSFSKLKTGVANRNPRKGQPGGIYTNPAHRQRDRHSQPSKSLYRIRSKYQHGFVFLFVSTFVML